MTEYLEGARNSAMAKDEQQEAPKPASPSEVNDGDHPNPQVEAPDWASMLRALYNAVVEEPLPDSFNDLLSKLDQDPA